MKQIVLSISMFIALLSQGQNIGVGNTNPLSRLDVSGSMGTAIQAVTSSITLDGTYSTILAGPGITLTLPPVASSAHRIYTIVFNAASGSVVTIKGNASDNITYAGAGANTFSLYGGSIVVQSDSIQWDVLNTMNWALKGNSNTSSPAAPSTYGTSTFQSSDNWIGNIGNSDLAFGTNDIERMRIMSSGFVGIGTAAPNTQFSNNATNTLGTDGAGVSSASLSWANNAAGYTAAFYNAGSATNANGLAVKTAGTGSNRLLDLSTGSQGTTGTSVMYVTSNGTVTVPLLGNKNITTSSNASTANLYAVYANAAGQLVGIPNRAAFNYGSHTTVVTSPTTWTWTCPTGVTQVFVKLWGAGGGYYGGGGGFVSGMMAVTPGTTYYIIVGQGGYTGSSTIECGGGGRGYSGGGNGGGRSAIRTSLAGPDLVTAGGGGGGNSCNNTILGGYGGNAPGNSAGSAAFTTVCNCSSAATGGSSTSTTGGCPPGTCSQGTGTQYVGTCGTYNGNISYSSGTLNQEIGGAGATKGSAGGGGGYTGGGGGNESSGAGGGSNYTGGLTTVSSCVPGGVYTTSGSVKGPAGNTTDIDYASGTASSNSTSLCGQGGSNGDGGDGYVVIYY